MASFRNYQPQRQLSNFELAIQLSQGNREDVKANLDALNDGFKSANDKAFNRLLRDSFEAKLDKLGITDYNAAYQQASGGRPLTSNTTLSSMIDWANQQQPQKTNTETTTTGGNDGGNNGGNNGGDDYKGPDPSIWNGFSQSQEEPEFGVGGPSSALDSGATGFRRKRSSARLAGLTNKGTSALKITGQTSKSSGLNIG